MTRLFTVLVIRKRRRPLVYPPLEGDRARELMQRLAIRGFETLATTKANDIEEQLTLAEMLAIYP